MESKERLEIQPTGSCFDDANIIISSFIRDKDPKWHDRLRLVHAICIMPETGKPYAHAWVELDGKGCIANGILNGEVMTYEVDRNEFYERMQVTETIVYTLRAAALAALRHGGHCGPWSKRIDALTRDSGVRKVFDD